MGYRFNPFTINLDFVGDSTGGGTVESVTGLDTDNTDPANPVVQISVDNDTITGAGTPEDPLVGHSPPAPAEWGGITGDIHDQTDLQAALDEKISTTLALAYAVAL